MKKRPWQLLAAAVGVASLLVACQTNPSKPTRALRVDMPTGGEVTGGTIACGLGDTTCSVRLAYDKTITLVGIPGPGNGQVAWSGDCSSSNEPQCTLTMDRDKHVGASFPPIPCLPGIPGCPP